MKQILKEIQKLSIKQKLQLIKRIQDEITKDRILQLLERFPEGLSTEEITALLNIN